jgi:hypothetical protein
MTYKIEHDDIQIYSEYPVSWEQKSNVVAGDKPIIGDQDHHYYRDYRPTRLQFELFSSQQNQTIDIHIPYNNRLTNIEAKYSVVCRYDSTSDDWKVVNFILDTENKKFIIHENRIGLYGVFVNYYWYSTYTQELANEFPHWTRIRKSKESLGQRFLNFFGIHFEEIEEYLNWIQEQKYIGTADIHMLDWIYVYDLMEVKQTDHIQVTHMNGAVNEPVEIFYTIREFFYNPSNRGGIIDYEKRRFYSKVKYEKLKFSVTRESQAFEFESTPMPFHVWNPLDDIGLLVGVQRLYLEKNKNLKERILDVFRYPSNTSDEGLTNGIARELDLIKREYTKNNEIIPLIWKDDSKSFYIKNTTGLPIDHRSLRVDGKPLEPNQYVMDADYNVLIHPLNEGKEHQISFIYGIEKYEMHNQKDENFYRMLYQPNGQATSKLLSWVEYINTVAPVMWGKFRWDEGFWDTIDKNLTGLGYVPNMWDSDIEVWKNYTFDPKRWESESIW